MFMLSKSLRIWLASNKTTYHTLPSDEKGPNGAEINIDSRHPMSPRCLGVFQIATIVLIVALSAVTALYLRLLDRTAPPRRLDCGQSLEEAHTKGCSFDNLAKSWLPKACPRYGMEEFTRAGHESSNGSAWRYYVDRPGSEEFILDEVAALAHSVEGATKWWTTGREHMYHCTWMLTRIAHVLNYGGRQDNLVVHFHHAKHCAQFMLDRALEGEGVDDIRVVGNTVFGSC